MTEQADLLKRGEALLQEIDTLKMRINGLRWKNPFPNTRLRNERIKDEGHGVWGGEEEVL